MVNVITLSKLIGLLLWFCPQPHCFDFENSKNTRNELPNPVMGTIFLVYIRSKQVLKHRPAALSYKS